MKGFVWSMFTFSTANQEDGNMWSNSCNPCIVLREGTIQSKEKMLTHN